MEDESEVIVFISIKLYSFVKIRVFCTLLSSCKSPEITEAFLKCINKTKHKVLSIEHSKKMLTSCRFLTGNPCTDYEGYREYVIATLPGLKVKCCNFIKKCLCLDFIKPIYYFFIIVNKLLVFNNSNCNN